jgi:hypothetical protein
MRGFGIDDGVKDVIPSPLADSFIGAEQKCFGDLEIDVRLSERIVLGVDDFLCILAV